MDRLSIIPKFEKSFAEESDDFEVSHSVVEIIERDWDVLSVQAYVDDESPMQPVAPTSKPLSTSGELEYAVMLL